MAERHSPLLSHQLEWTLFGFEKFQVILWFDEKTVFGRQREFRRTQFGEPCHCQFGGADNFGFPREIEVSYAKQFDLRGYELLLNREQGWDFNIAGMEVDLDYRIVEDLKFDKAQVFDGKGSGIVIRLRVPQCGPKLDTVFEHPRPFGGNKHRQAIQEPLSAAISGEFSGDHRLYA